MDTIDLMREYVRVADMCKGTDVKPWECVKLEGSVTITFDSNDSFLAAIGSRIPMKFAVAILEGKPVFVEDEVYWGNGNKFDWNTDSSICLASHIKNMTWTPPTKKRTFMLELDDSELLSLINIVSKNNWTDVMVNFGKKLTKARDKE